MKNTWNLRGSNAITLQISLAFLELIQEVRCHHCLVWESTTLGSSPLENWHRSIRMRNFGCGLLWLLCKAIIFSLPTIFASQILNWGNTSFTLLELCNRTTFSFATRLYYSFGEWLLVQAGRPQPDVVRRGEFGLKLPAEFRSDLQLMHQRLRDLGRDTGMWIVLAVTESIELIRMCGFNMLDAISYTACTYIGSQSLIRFLSVWISQWGSAMVLHRATPMLLTISHSQNPDSAQNPTMPHKCFRRGKQWHSALDLVESWQDHAANVKTFSVWDGQRNFIEDRTSSRLN